MAKRRASTVRRKRKPAGSDIEPDPRVEQSHVSFLAGWAGKVSAIQRAHWPELRNLIASEQARLGTRSDAAGARVDAVPKSLNKVNSVIADMVAEYSKQVKSGESGAEKRAMSIEGALESTSSDAWALNIESLVDQTPGLDRAEKSLVNEFLISEEPDIPKRVRRSWIREQLGLISGKPVAPVKVAGKLIESISGRSMKRLNSIVTKGILRGTRVESIMGQLAELPGITKRHAETLARDQVVKQNGRMTRIRHEGISVTHYTWQTVGDERVRKTHRVFGRGGGQRYSYKKGAGPNGVNPGEEILCRCWASPDLKGALANLKAKRARGDRLTPRVGRVRVSGSLVRAALARADAVRHAHCATHCDGF
jgi:SPP1 gp7 family putative phage head morphogenesis protein